MYTMMYHLQLEKTKGLSFSHCNWYELLNLDSLSVIMVGYFIHGGTKT